METRAAALPVGREGPLTQINGWIGHVFDRQRGHLFCWLPVMIGIGIAVYFGWNTEPSIPQLTGLACGGAITALIAMRGQQAISPVFWGVTLIIFGVLLSGFRAHHVAAPALSFRYYGPIEGRVVAIDRSGSDKVRLTLDHVALDRVSPAKTPVRVRVSLHGEQPFMTPRPGMIVMMSGHLSPPPGPTEPGGFDFQRKAWFERLGAIGYTRSPALVLDPGRQDSLGLRLYAFRKDLAQAIKTRMGGVEGPFAAAIVTGDRTDIDPGALDALRGSNLAHLLAISGLHMGLLTGAVFTVIRVLLTMLPRTPTRFSPKKVAAVCALVAATLYLGISGASVATQRAFLMAAVMLVAICFERRALTLRAVAIAALAVLLIRPESLTGPGFQMSFAATIGLVSVFSALRDTDWMYRLPGWVRPVAMLVLSSGVAGLATAPFGAAHFNQVAQYGLVANLISVPVMGIVVMPGAVIAALLAPIGLESIGLEIMRLGLAWIIGVARFITAQSGAVSLVPAPGRTVLPLVAMGGLFLCLWAGRGRLLGAGVIALSIMLWSQTERPQVLVSESGLLIGILKPAGRALNKPKGDGFTARTWLENDGDTATQQEAAARSDMDRKLVRVTLGSHVLTFDARKDLGELDIAGHCRASDLVIAPLYKGPSTCTLIDTQGLRDGGAIAIWPDTDGVALRIETSKGLRGPRLWVQ